MYYLEHEPDTMAPFLRGLIRRFLASRITNPSTTSNHRNSSYSYLHNLGSIENQPLQETEDNNEDSSPSTSVEYNLESIPGL